MVIAGLAPSARSTSRSTFRAWSCRANICTAISSAASMPTTPNTARAMASGFTARVDLSLDDRGDVKRMRLCLSGESR
jgi:hypothetical protein